ncbi:Protein ABSCISIC ACID-INSENSITIVE like [Heracleum sosnowskyi]|uniref:Protein ABSCISIC ACID-INSENSITIVE like n=1 Tax=Heracleum sosnowskyi TaxID=360622 RepID=A0AAD8MM92_9APIA|nr:Protein ABSCISIC ACID-INSENSITIVE like [Heracleum sosnowskyi]
MSYQQLTKTREEALTRNLGMEEVPTDQSDHEVKSALQIEEPEQQLDPSPPMEQNQNTLTSDGKSGGSMNLDEFLTSIWTAEENEAQAPNANTMVPTEESSTSLTNMNPQYHFGESSNIARQVSLTRGSPSVPAPSCQKTVEKVWSEINRNQQSTNKILHAGSKQRKRSYGEMTLQEFLVEAGVVREEAPAAQIPPPRLHFQPQHHLQSHPAPPVFQPRPAPPVFQPRPAPPVFQPRPAPPLLPRPQLPNGYGMYFNYDSTTMSNFMITGCGTSSVGVPSPFRPQPQTVGGTVATCFPGGNIRIGLQPAASFCGVGSASGVRGSESFGEMSAVSLDGIGMNQAGRKRIIDRQTQLMIEQRRMIRNRESAMRSRERKQAYTLELEVALNQLRHENANLLKRMKEMESESKQLKPEAAKIEAQAKAKEKRGQLRRTFSSPF